jgi:hypothetical protein
LDLVLRDRLPRLEPTDASAASYHLTELHVEVLPSWSGRYGRTAWAPSLSSRQAGARGRSSKLAPLLVGASHEANRRLSCGAKRRCGEGECRVRPLLTCSCGVPGNPGVDWARKRDRRACARGCGGRRTGPAGGSSQGTRQRDPVGMARPRRNEARDPLRAVGGPQPPARGPGRVGEDPPGRTDCLGPAHCPAGRMSFQLPPG